MRQQDLGIKLSDVSMSPIYLTCIKRAFFYFIFIIT